MIIQRHTSLPGIAVFSHSSKQKHWDKKLDTNYCFGAELNETPTYPNITREICYSKQTERSSIVLVYPGSILDILTHWVKRHRNGW